MADGGSPAPAFPISANTLEGLAALTDFANTTGEPVFDATLKQALAVKLEESPFLAVASEQRVQDTLRFMKRPADAPLTRDLGRDVCQRQSAHADQLSRSKGRTMFRITLSRTTTEASSTTGRAPPRSTSCGSAPIRTTQLRSSTSGRSTVRRATTTARSRRGRPARAIALVDRLEPLAPKNGGVFRGMLIRGDALLAAGRAKEADAQYQAVLDHRTFAPFDLAVPLAQLGVAEARARGRRLGCARGLRGVLRDAEGCRP